MQEKIKNLINEVLKNLNIDPLAGGSDFVVEHPADLKMGDYATNIAMVLSKSLKQNPREIAEKIVKEINLTTSPSLLERGNSKVEIAGAGL